MEEQVIKKLEKVLRKENGKITIEDVDRIKFLKLFPEEQDLHIENILISLYNLTIRNTLKIEDLETHLNMLVNRIYDVNEDFSKEELTEIETTLNLLDDDELNDLKSNKEILYDSLYADQYDSALIDKKRKQLFNKIQYPTKQMHDTFERLLNNELSTRK